MFTRLHTQGKLASDVGELFPSDNINVIENALVMAMPNYIRIVFCFLRSETSYPLTTNFIKLHYTYMCFSKAACCI